MWKRLKFVRKWRLWALVVVCLVFLLPCAVVADSSEGVVVSATGWIAGAPGGFTITYVSDYEVELSWTMGVDAVNVMVRAAYGREPEDRADGYLVYQGSGTSATDAAIALSTPEIVYYRAWSQNVGGVWSELFSTVDTGGFMSMSFLFLTLVVLGLVLFLAAFRWKDLLLSWSAGLTWLAIGFWWALGGIENFDLSENWMQILVVVPFLLFFVVMLRLMNTEITYEKEGKRWTGYGAPPREKGPSGYEAYRNQLYVRTRRK